MTTHAYVPNRFVETDTRCHCGALKIACPAWIPRRHIICRIRKDGKMIGHPLAFIAPTKDRAMEKAKLKWPRSRVHYVREED